MAKLERNILCLVLLLTLVERARPVNSADLSLDLPELPRLALESFAPSLRSTVQKAYALVAANARDSSANGKLGMMLQANNHFEEAEVCYRRAHLLDPASFRWAYLLGLLQASKGNCDGGAATLQEALRLDSGYLPAQLKLGECLLGSGRWADAAKVYQSIVSQHSDSADANYGLGLARAIRNDLIGAIELFRRAIDRFPNFGAANYALAHAYQRLGKTDQSLEQLALFEKNRASEPQVEDRILGEISALNSNADERLRLGIELAWAGKLEEAVTADEHALRIDPQLVAAHVHLISVYGRLGQFDKAEQHFQVAMSIDPSNAESYFNHGLLLASESRLSEAEAAFRKTLQINLAFRDAHTNLATMLEAQDKLPEAIAEYQQALENNRDDSRAHFSLGRLAVNQEKYQEGIEHLQKSLSTDDEQAKPSYLYALGAAYARSGDRDSGLRYLRMARDKASTLGQSKLVENIDEDLRTLRGDGRPQ